MATEVGLRELLEAGVHFGHQTRRWNPGMRRYIHGERDGIHIIDLLQTEKLLADAREFAAGLARKGGTVLFVGTKKQARDSIKEWADRSGMPYVNQRWLGGLLTNFQTISTRIERLHELTAHRDEGRLELLPTKERMSMEAELRKLEFNLGGVRDMRKPPDAVVVVDLKAETIGVKEAARLRIPVIGLVDSNCDPREVDFVIPGNDDAIRSCDLVIRAIGEAVEEAASAFRVEDDERRRKEAEERERRRAEDQARKEAEEEARQKAEEQTAVAAAAQAATVDAAAQAEAAQAQAAQAEIDKAEADKLQAEKVDRAQALRAEAESSQAEPVKAEEPEPEPAAEPEPEPAEAPEETPAEESAAEEQVEPAEEPAPAGDKS